MTDSPKTERRASVSRMVADLGDDAYRQDGILSRADVDAAYLRKGIHPDEAITIERELYAQGVEIDDGSDGDDSQTSPVRPSGTVSGDTAVERLLSHTRNYPLLGADQEAELGWRIQLGQRAREQYEPGSEILERVEKSAVEAKRTMILSNLRLVAKTVFERRFRLRMDQDDLMQFGIIGLMTASEKYDPGWGTRFSTYATWWIRQSISRGINNQSTTIRIPVHMRNKITQFRRTRRVLGANDGLRASDLQPIADHLGWDLAYTARIAQLSDQHVISFDDPVGEGPKATIADRIASDGPNPETVAADRVFVEVVRSLVDGLDNPRMIDVVKRRFGIDGPQQTLEEIGRDYGVTRERIRQIESKALKILRYRAIRAQLQHEDAR